MGQSNKKIYAGIALAAIALAVVFALLSFLRQNWGADQTPGSLEKLVARWLLSGSREAQDNNQSNPLTPTPQHVEEGGKLYQSNCAFCHGPDGRGPADSGVRFYPPVPSLVQNLGQLNDSQVYTVISRGVRYTGMPSFAQALTAEQIWTITVWLRHLPSSSVPRGPVP